MVYKSTEKKRGNLAVRLLFIVFALLGYATGMQSSENVGYSLEEGVPNVTMFYPGKSEPAQGVAVNTTIYIYFDRLVYSADCQFIQKGNVLGVVNFLSTAGATAAKIVQLKKTDFAAVVNELGLESGEFTIKIKSICYPASDGTTQIFEDVDGDLPSVTYTFAGLPAGIDSETHFEDNTVLSYYPSGSPAAIKTITFNAPIMANGIKAELTYGTDFQINIFPVSTSLSEDGKVLTLDLSGVLRNVESMPNHDFRDDNGNPAPPPTTIILDIYNLITVDGRQVATVTTDGVHTHTLYGSAHYVYNYKDITFATPRLTKAEFYAQSEPGKKYDAITSSSDMMNLSIENAGCIASADMVFLSVGKELATVSYEDIVFSGSTMTVSLPETVRAAGSGNLSIGLENVKYNQEDGANHVIKPLVLYSSVVEVTTIADMKTLDEGVEVILKANDVKVTMSNEGLTFVEDETGALLIYGTTFAEGKAINGTIAGTYAGSGQFNLNETKSEYTQTDAVITGTVMTVEEAMKEENLYRLATFTKSNGTLIEYDDEQNYIIIGNVITTIDDFLPVGYTYPSNIASVTGILYVGTAAESLMLILRDTDDISTTTNISSVNDDASIAKGDVYSVNGVLIRKAGDYCDGLDRGIYVVNGKKLVIR